MDVEDLPAISTEDLVRRIEELDAELALLQERYRRALAEAAGWWLRGRR
jgi:hypothetical protein